MQILLKNTILKILKNTLSFHGYHGNSTRHMLVNCMSKDSPLHFSSRKVVKFHQYSLNRVEVMAKKTLGG